jgi:drug/metabolite transporter (DMT)-like permease
MPSIASPHRLAMGPLDWTLLLLLGFLWGGSFNLIQVALRELPPLTLVALRVTLSAAVLYAVARIAGHSMALPWNIWQSFAVMGLLNNLLPHTLNAYGQTQIGSGLAAILTASTPLFAVVFAHLFTRDERMTVFKAAGVLAGIAGVAVIIGADALQGVGLKVLGQFAVLLAAMSGAMAGVFGRRLRGVPALVSATGQTAWTLLFMLPIALIADWPWQLPMPGPTTWLAVAGIALGGTVLGYIIFFRLLARVGATNLLLVTFLNPITALLLGALFLGEIIEARHLAGMGLIALGLVAIDGRVFAWRRAAIGT